MLGLQRIRIQERKTPVAVSGLHRLGFRYRRTPHADGTHSTICLTCSRAIACGMTVCELDFVEAMHACLERTLRRPGPCRVIPFHAK